MVAGAVVGGKLIIGSLSSSQSAGGFASHTAALETVPWIVILSPGWMVLDRRANASSPDTVTIASRRRIVNIYQFDKDFGELAFKAKTPAACGIILFRTRKQTPETVSQKAVETLLAARTDWAGQFSVVEDDRVRMTKLPE